MRDPQRIAATRAYVVGIEQYALGGRANRLSGPVADAHRFVAWLIAQGLKSEQITVFLSEVTQPLGPTVPPLPAGVDRRGATSAGFHSAVVNELAATPPQIFWLYWGGHGLMDDEQRYGLFTDATERSGACLNPEDLWRFLRSVKAGPGSLEQVLMVFDVCSTYAHLAKLEGVLAPISFGGTKAREITGRNLWTLVASRRGEAADNINPEQTGLLSRELRQLLSAPNADPVWPPDFGRLNQGLRERFDALRQADKKVQGLAYYREETPNGSAAPVRFGPDWEVIERLVNQAQPPLADALLKEAYRLAAVGNGRPLPSDTRGNALPEQILHRLMGLQPATVLSWVEYCRLVIPNAELVMEFEAWQEDWARQQGLNLAEVRANCAASLARLKQAAASAAEVVLQGVVVPLHTGTPRRYQLSLYRRVGDGAGEFLGLGGEVAETELETLPARFAELFKRTHSDTHARPQRLEIALPFELYALEPEHWPIPAGRNAKGEPVSKPVGLSYPVVVRSYDLNYDESGSYVESTQLRQSRCPLPAAALAPEAIAGTDSVEQLAREGGYAWAEPAIVALVASRFEPSQPVGSDRTLASELTNAGLPLAVWLRGNTLDPGAAQAWLATEILAHPPVNWPARVQGLRKPQPGSAPSWQGITLLWDPCDFSLPQLLNSRTDAVQGPTSLSSP